MTPTTSLFSGLMHLRFDSAVRKLLDCAVSSEGFPSGQREQTVNLPALPTKVRILPPPPADELAHVAQLVEHVLGKDEVSSSILDVGSGEKNQKIEDQRAPKERSTSLREVKEPT